MIEIILLFFLTRNIGVLAERKGQPPGRWKLYTVLAWFLFEIGGAIVSYTIVQDLMLNVIFGLVAAFGGFLLIKYRLERLPDDNSKDWTERIGQDDLPS